MKKENSNGKIPASDLALFCEQVSLIYDSGMPLYDGLETLMESANTAESKDIFKKILSVVIDTGSLYMGIKDINVFPDYMKNMLYIGEETGKIDDVLKSLKKYYEREAKIKKSLKSAITYPVILLIMMSLVALLIITKIMPVFQNIFKNLGTDIPESGKRIMDAASYLGYGMLIVTFILIIVIVVLLILNSTGRNLTVSAILSKIPFTKKVLVKITASRFSSVMSMMLESGYSLEKAFEMAPSVLDDNSTKQKIENCGQMIKDGVKFEEAIEKTEIFDAMAARTAGLGYKAGKIDTVMEQLSKRYDEEVTDTIEKLLGVIEPTLVAIMSVIIGGILVSVMLPLANIMSQIG